MGVELTETGRFGAKIFFAARAGSGIGGGVPQVGFPGFWRGENPIFPAAPSARRADSWGSDPPFFSPRALRARNFLKKPFSRDTDPHIHFSCRFSRPVNRIFFWRAREMLFF
jgi:hypothetical protein